MLYPQNAFPFAMFGCRVVARNFVSSRQADEMVDAGDVEKPQVLVYALDPPRETVGTHRVPIVNRVSPKLSGRAEKIGRNASHERRRALRVELEFRLVAPDVCRVERNIDGDVADDRNAL